MNLLEKEISSCSFKGLVSRSWFCFIFIMFQLNFFLHCHLLHSENVSVEFFGVKRGTPTTHKFKIHFYPNCLISEFDFITRAITGQALRSREQQWRGAETSPLMSQFPVDVFMKIFNSHLSQLAYFIVFSSLEQAIKTTTARIQEADIKRFLKHYCDACLFTALSHFKTTHCLCLSFLSEPTQHFFFYLVFLVCGGKKNRSLYLCYPQCHLGGDIKG